MRTITVVLKFDGQTDETRMLWEAHSKRQKFAGFTVVAIAEGDRCEVDDDRELCQICDGSGEGQAPDSVCSKCRGSGVESEDYD